MYNTLLYLYSICIECLTLFIQHLYTVHYILYLYNICIQFTDIYAQYHINTVHYYIYTLQVYSILHTFMIQHCTVLCCSCKSPANGLFVMISLLHVTFHQYHLRLNTVEVPSMLCMYSNLSHFLQWLQMKISQPSTYA